ncbi:WD repeat-containing protein 75 [Amyelois transitella]|uniref:WD repeat-containing protein 75 n=1 Tax=Amyelois transitella TaxID=680683 RepID=UPI00067C3AF7|nr:WD repeat-containing protein 75 [Amyelois transitella]
MGVKTYNSNIVDCKYNFQRKSCRSIIERQPVFSPDGLSVLVIVENVIRVYNIQTCDCVRTLETESKVNEIVNIEFPDNEDYNLYGCSDNGCVTTWTWEKGAVLRETNLKLPPNTRVVTFNMIDNSKCFITAMRTSSIQLHLGTYSLKTGDLLMEYTHREVKYNEMIRVAIGWCYGYRFAAIINGTKILTIQNLDQPHVVTYLTNSNQIRILGIAAHHKENAVAISDALGRVTVMRGNLFDYSQVAKEQMHWHYLPVFAVCFSKQGSYLYSGGMEEVLIKWTLGHLANKSDEKEFIPRIPGIIRFITVNNTHVAVTLSNNSVVIASTQLRVVSTILECGGLSPAARAIGTSFVYHRPSAALLMGGRTGHLQVYSTTTNKVLYNIDVTQVNKISAQRENLMPLETEITCAAVNRDGQWLVTSEYRNDGLMYPEEKLKFWSFSGKHGPSFTLNTCVNLSHGGCNVVSLALDNRGEFCVSAGADQKFRIWKRESHKTTEGKRVAWSCLTACYYSSGIAQFTSNDAFNKFKVGDIQSSTDSPRYMTVNDNNDVVRKIFRAHKEIVGARSVDPGMKSNKDLDMGGVAISQDASLIAAWFGCKLTLWDTHLCTLRTVLSHPALRPKGKQVKFGSSDAAHYLVCTTDTVLAVWSLLSLSIKWLVQTHPTCLTSDPFSNKMAVTTTNNDVYVFTPHSSVPVLNRKALLDPKTGVFKLCTFGASSGDDIRLYLMRNDTEIYSLEPEKTEEDSLEVISRRNLPTSNFGALLAETQLSGVRQAVPVSTDAEQDTANTSVLQFLAASPHMVPPVSLLCTSFLQQMSGQTQEVEDQTEEQGDKAREEPDSSDEEGALKERDVPKVEQFWTPSYENVKEKKLIKILKEPFLDLHTTSTICGL